MLRSSTPLPILSCASTIQASQSPFLSKAKSETLPMLSSLALARSSRMRSEPCGLSSVGGVVDCTGGGGAAGVGVGAYRCAAIAEDRSPEKAKRLILSNSVLLPVASSTRSSLLWIGFRCFLRVLASLAVGYTRNAAQRESSESAKSRGGGGPAGGPKPKFGRGNSPIG